MGFKELAIAATAGGSILLTGVVFTGSVNLADIKAYGFGWADRVNTAVNETTEMIEKFNIFKSDAQEQLNEKIAKINELNAKIADLVSQVESGQAANQGTLDSANSEIARLNEELQKANEEVQALKDEFASKNTEVEAAFSEMATAESMDTSMVLDTQNPDTVVPEGTEAPEAPEAPEEAPVNDYAAEEAAVANAIKTRFGVNVAFTVTMTETSITLNGTGLATKFDGTNTIAQTEVGTAAGVTITGASQPDNNTLIYTY